MKWIKSLKYRSGITYLLIFLLVLYWFISYKMNTHGTNSAHVHPIHIAFSSILVKAIFICVIVFYLLPVLSKKRNLLFFSFQILAWLAICFFIEQFFQALLSKPNIPDQHTQGVLHHNPIWWMNLLLYVFILVVLFAWHFTKEWIINEKQKRELIEERFSTEVLFLKNQINPHFLFNTLNNLFSIAQRNKDTETAQGLSQLAGLMRYMIYDSSVPLISLEKEVKNIHDFIALSKLRYPNDEVHVQVFTNGDIEKISIAPMILLPFIENSFKHGVHIEEKSIISIRFEVKGDTLFFTCTNPIVDTARMKHIEYGGIGLENVQRRLTLLYPQKHKLTISNSDNTFTVHLVLNT